MKNLRSLALVGLFATALSSFASADVYTYTIPTNGITTNAVEGDAANFLTSINLGAGAEVTGIGWNVTLTAFDPSWLSEATVSFQDSAAVGGVFLSVGNGDDFAGTNVAYTSGGIVDLTSLDLNFTLADGALDLEFFEGFNDASVTPDARFAGGGTFNIQYTPGSAVPEPASMAALGLGAVALLRRRNKKA